MILTGGVGGVILTWGVGGVILTGGVGGVILTGGVGGVILTGEQKCMEKIFLSYPLYSTNPTQINLGSNRVSAMSVRCLTA